MTTTQRTAHAQRARGFTLVELMVVVAIIAIIAAIAIPQYSDYVTRSKLTEAHAKLADARVKLEQFFMDSRTYVGGAAPWACGSPAPSAAESKYFSYTCTSTATTYTVTATGVPAQGLDGIAFTLDQSNTKATVVTAATPMATAGYTSQACWITKKGAC